MANIATDMVQVNVRLSRALKIHLDRLASNSGVTASEIARLILTDSIKNVTSVVVDYKLEYDTGPPYPDGIGDD